MADQKEPKKETVRISSPAPPDSKSTGTERGDTVRIDVLRRAKVPESIPPQVTPPKHVPPPLPKSSTAEPSASASAPTFRPPAPPNLPPPLRTPTAPNAAAAVQPPPARERHPKKETARINILPNQSAVAPSARTPGVNMAKTQPLMKAPADAPPLPPLNVGRRVDKQRAAGSSTINAIPLPLLWVLLAISALTFLIQVWNYFSV